MWYCPKCKRYNAMEHRGNGFLYCIWRDCGYMVYIDNWRKPKINLDRYKKFRDSIKIKTSII